MADRDQSWGFGRRGGDRDRNWGRSRPDDRGGRRADGERRTFEDDPERRYGQGARGEREGGEPWRGESRYGARYDPDRAGYGGQEYGLEASPGRREEPSRGRPDRETREVWRPDRGEPYGDLELNPDDRGVQDYGPPHDYAYHPQAGHAFDPDYLRWRDEQLRGHDRDYREWRRHQQQQYDEDYHRFRAERRDTFGRTFQDWRSQRSAVGGREDLSVAPGVSGYGDKTATPGGYTGRNLDKPSGMIEPISAMTASPGLAQTGRGPTSEDAERVEDRPAADDSPEFGKAPPQVQAAAEGWDARGAPEDKLEHDKSARDEARREDGRGKDDETKR